MALPILALLPVVASAFTAVKDLVIKFWPNDEDRAKVEKIRAEIKVIEDEIANKVRESDERLAQLQINLADAQSPRWWQSGWRPGLGWVCVVAWFIDIIAVPTYNFFAVVQLPGLAEGKVEIVMWLTAGLAGIRMIDKGIQKKFDKDCNCK